MNPLREYKLEQSTYDLFAIWLKSYFDGAAHAIGGNAGVMFPKAALGFAQSALPQPLTASGPQVGITMTFAADTGRNVSRRWEVGPPGTGRQQMFYKPMRWNFWVRCETADDKARALCMNAAQLLESILANAACTRPLAQMGVHRIRPGSAVPVADTTYILRLVPCHATLKYAVLSQGATPVVLPPPPPGVAPTARMNNGVFELWDAGQSAYVPVVVNNGTLGVGAADQG